MKSKNDSLSKSSAKSLSQQLRNNATSSLSRSLNHLPSNTLPSLRSLSTTASSQNFDNFHEQKDPLRNDARFTRLSGTVDHMNTSGLFSENRVPYKPSILCVRCNDSHASICMPCGELICENTLTFYRKTRAAGAAALFTKAFVEAGNSKLVKFFIFRLLRNSYEARMRKKIKMKTVIERLFGTNIVYIPFAAWRRFTKENIVSRKEKTIVALNEKVQDLQFQTGKLFSENKRLENEMEQLRRNYNLQVEENKHQKKQIDELKSLLLKEKERVLGLATLAQPLSIYSSLADSLIQKESNEIRHFLQTNATSIASHNFGHIFKPTVLNDVARIYKENERAVQLGKDFTATPSQIVLESMVAVNPHDKVKMQLLLDWLSVTSYNAASHTDKATGKSYALYLPTTDKLASISDICSGRDLIRVVVSLVAEYKKLYDAAQMMSGSSTALSSIADISNTNNLKGAASSTTKVGKGKFAVRTARVAVEIGMTDLQYIKKHTNNPFELIEFAIKLARYALNIPDFKPADIYSGKTDACYSLIIALIMCSDPTIQAKEATELGEQMNKYTEFNMKQSQLREERDRYIVHLSDIANMLQKCDGGNNNNNNNSNNLAKKLSGHFAAHDVISAHAANSRESASAGSRGSNHLNMDTLQQAVGEMPSDAAGGDGHAHHNDSNKPQLRRDMSSTVSLASTADVHTARSVLSQTNTAAQSELLKDILAVDEHYDQLTQAIDMFLGNSEPQKILHFSQENASYCNKHLFDLISSSAALRDRREAGIRLTTELKQFMLCNYFENSANRMGMSIGSHAFSGSSSLCDEDGY